MLYTIVGICVIATAFFIALRVTKGGVYGILSKTLASLCFVVLGLYGAYKTGLTMVAAFVIIGLILGMIGDIVLDLKVVYKEHNDSYLNAGMLSFGLGHVSYFIALTLLCTKVIFKTSSVYGGVLLIALGIAGILTISIMAFISPMLKLNFGKFKIQTYLYTFALTFMTAYALTVGIWWTPAFIYGAGLGLIFLSDLILSNQYFGKYADNKLFTILNHAIYYAGQIVIALFLYFI